MTVLTESEYETVLRALREAPPTPERKHAVAILKTAHIGALVREINAENQPCALLRPQAE